MVTLAQEIGLERRIEAEVVAVAKKRKILLVYPEFPDTFWGFNEVLRFIHKRSSHPPLGLITAAAMIPNDYEVELVDLNIEGLNDKQIKEADFVFASSMVIQQRSLEQIISRANKLGTPVVVGGPFPTQYYDHVKGADHFVLGEAESGVLDAFFRDLETGCLKRVYARPAEEEELNSLKESFEDCAADIKIAPRPDITKSPTPRFDLLNMDAYSSMSMQLSRGCPFDCEFCSETSLAGRKTRLKDRGQLVAELKALHDLGYKGSVFIVDDNFIGNIRKIKDILPMVEEFQKRNGYPFNLYTEASINLASDEDLMNAMNRAGFGMVFVGIESPDQNTLESMNKTPNRNRDLLEAVKTIQSHGLEVTAGFIVGNDTDPYNIGDLMFDFCQKAGIPTSMVGLLTPVRGSRLYGRLKKEGRLLDDFPEGSNTYDFMLRFVPPEGKSADEIVEGYKDLLSRLYSMDGKNYFERCRTYLDNLGPRQKASLRNRLSNITWTNINALRKSLFEAPSPKYKKNYRMFLWDTIKNHPKLIGEAIRLGIIGQHFALITHYAIRADELKNEILETQDSLLETLKRLMPDLSGLRGRIADGKASFQGIVADKKTELQEMIERAQNYLTERRGLPQRRIESELEQVQRRIDGLRSQMKKLPQQYKLRLQEQYNELAGYINTIVGREKVRLYST